MEFTAYSALTGQVLYSGAADDPMALQSEDTRVMLGHKFGPGFIDNGVYSPCPPRPEGKYVFDAEARQWINTNTESRQWDRVRFERNKRLTATDWTQLPDVPLAAKEAWAVYRQALRDVTEQPNPFNIAWPVQPK